MKRILVAVACLLPFALAAEAGIGRHSPEAAVKAAYAADEAAIQGRGPGVMGDNTLRARFFSRSLLRSIAADEVIGGAPPALIRDPFIDRAPHLVALSIAPISEARDEARVLAEFARGDGARERLTYAMVFERGEWRIDDIAYAMLDGESHSLRGMLAAD
ncbi:MAG TPA: hypothetical protein VN637_09660 [Roseiarcus sp.]|jgi:hypothetical protein|nr:hypothetical protein [Roseiarcus sp.]